MYYLVNVDHNSMAVHLTRNDCEGHDGDNDTDWQRHIESCMLCLISV